MRASARAQMAPQRPGLCLAEEAEEGSARDSRHLAGLEIFSVTTASPLVASGRQCNTLICGEYRVILVL